MKLDLSKFKKAEENEKFTILAHPSGHKIKISKQGLSEENKKQIEDMEKPQKLAKGGYTLPPGRGVGPEAAGNSKNSGMSKAKPTGQYTEPQAMGTPTPPNLAGAATLNQHEAMKEGMGGASFGKQGQVYPPCINPSCKSYGKSHPNCRCYGGNEYAAERFADGGEVSKEYYCDNNRAHFKKCDYYAEGGNVKGVHGASKEGPGVSEAGSDVRKVNKNNLHGTFKKAMLEPAREEHRQKLDELKSMPKPKIQGFDDGGSVQPQPTPQPSPQNDNSDDALQSAQQSMRNAFHFDEGGDVPDAQPQPELKGDAVADNSDIPQADPSATPAPDAPSQAPDIDREIASASDAAGPQPEAAPQSPPQQDPNDPNSDPYAANPQTIDPYQNYQQKAGDANNLMHDEMNKFYADVDSGKVQPKTLHDLYHDKSTLGKIGTLFGLIVAGGGAGLTHTDNAALAQMNKEIKNDLGAQEQNQANRRNLFTINGQNLSQLANAGKIGADTRQMNIAMSKGMQNYATYNELARQAGNITNPQQAQKAQMTLAFMREAMQKDNASAFAQAAGANALGSMLRGGGNTAALKTGLLGPEAQEYGNDLESKTIPGIGIAKLPVPQHVRDQTLAMKTLSDKAQDLINYSKQNIGTLDPAKRAVAKQKAAEMVNFYNNSIQGGVLTEGRLGWLDDQIKKNPTGVVTQLLGNTQRLQEIKSSNDNRMGLMLKQYGVPVKQQAMPQAQAQTKNINGAQYQKVNGGWQKVK